MTYEWQGSDRLSHSTNFGRLSAKQFGLLAKQFRAKFYQMGLFGDTIDRKRILIISAHVCTGKSVRDQTTFGYLWVSRRYTGIRGKKNLSNLRKKDCVGSGI